LDLRSLSPFTEQDKQSTLTS